MGFSRQEYWSGLPFPSLGDLPDPGLKPTSPVLAGRFFTTSPPESENHSVVSDTLQPHGLYGPWNSPGQNTGVGSLALLQWIFPAQELNPGLPCYQLSHQGSPRVLEWVAYPFSHRSSQPRHQTVVPCIEGRFFTSWGAREDTWEATKWSCSFKKMIATPDQASPISYTFLALWLLTWLHGHSKSCP